MMALDYIANEAKRDDTSACTITSPSIAVSPNLKKSPITGSQLLTTLNLKCSDVQTSDHESVSHQTSHSVSASLSDVMWCRKKLFVDHGALSIETNKNLSATDCMQNLKHSLTNAKDCKQKVPVKKHTRSEKKNSSGNISSMSRFLSQKNRFSPFHQHD